MLGICQLRQCLLWVTAEKTKADSVARLVGQVNAEPFSAFAELEALKEPQSDAISWTELLSGTPCPCTALHTIGTFLMSQMWLGSHLCAKTTALLEACEVTC